MSEFKIHGLSAEGEAYCAALVSIQELHKRDSDGYCSHYECHDSYGDQIRFPCDTRRLADDALGGDRE